MIFFEKAPTHFFQSGVFRLNRHDSAQQKGISQTTAKY
ncbi:hypothetical protein CLV51_102383 [Chitinophaga niastensis]|uniref:Uncharacterized protein n=1 Tax=Chitinophaga niastensis TaxID=536980 RepID=A0A2P8HMV5_CHINA|nr:hypothetical protein CLV51_102383 [Chitinophaga niastensis]